MNIFMIPAGHFGRAGIYNMLIYRYIRFHTKFAPPMVNDNYERSILWLLCFRQSEKVT